MSPAFGHDRPSSCPPRGPLALLGLTLVLSGALAILGGCQSGARRTPKEILDYKRALLMANEELTAEQRTLILHYPGSSYEEMDEVLESAQQGFEDSEEARARAERSGAAIGDRRRETRRQWVRTQDGNFLLERVPFDPLGVTEAAD